MSDIARITQNGVALTVKHAAIAASSSGANIIVAAVTGKRIVVLSYAIMASAAVNGKWQSKVGADAATDISGLKYLAAAGSGVVNSHNPHGWVKTAVSGALHLNLSGATAVGGELTYVEAE